MGTNYLNGNETKKKCSKLRKMVPLKGTFEGVRGPKNVERMSLEGVVITGSSVGYAACRYLFCLSGALVVLLRLCWFVYDRTRRRKRDGDGDTHVPACPYSRRDQSTRAAPQIDYRVFSRQQQ